MADEQKPAEIPKQEEAKEDRMKRLNISDVPFHTYETEQIQKQREKK